MRRGLPGQAPPSPGRVPVMTTADRADHRMRPRTRSLLAVASPLRPWHRANAKRAKDGALRPAGWTVPHAENEVSGACGSMPGPKGAERGGQGGGCRSIGIDSGDLPLSTQSLRKSVLTDGAVRCGAQDARSRRAQASRDADRCRRPAPTVPPGGAVGAGRPGGNKGQVDWPVRPSPSARRRPGRMQSPWPARRRAPASIPPRRRPARPGRRSAASPGPSAPPRH